VRAARARALPALLVAAAAAACAPAKKLPPARTAEELLAPYLAVTFGAPVDGLRQARPELAPSGWSEGSRATWVDPSLEAGLEIGSDGGAVISVTIVFGPQRGPAVANELGRRLGPGVTCGTLPEGMSSFRPELWRLADDSGVAMIRKQRVVELRVDRPAAPGFVEMLTGCRR
jgi:hypothetical protein